MKKNINLMWLPCVTSLLVAGCGQSAEEKIASYLTHIQHYDCEALNKESRFNEQMIEKLAEADKNYDPLPDVAMTTLTLGTDLIRDSNSPSSSRNYNRRILILQDKQKIISELKQERCPHAL